MLLILGSGDVSLGDALNLEVVAKEVVATLVGSIGLIAAVPVTTALAAALSRGLRPSSSPTSPRTFIEAHPFACESRNRPRQVKPTITSEHPVLRARRRLARRR